ncbi:hypothetical protein N5079_12300 [Planotetraspora sp. A-T 1434]|uniref:hypothetical protein n=1 Tax=Planotetraspora sp. A-T 1434 TaxID=2979219 RepID=UPI0021BE57E4|nr:hypothetical protein [Planotetraspora sp. A-T 1434]MCT9930999.1 hypothetical protein [Planotetraspora sp. A-T 1434]
MTPDDEARERERALELLRTAFPDYRIVYGGGRWAAAAAGDPPTVWFAQTPSSLCGQLFLAQLRNGGTIAPLHGKESNSQCAG